MNMDDLTKLTSRIPDFSVPKMPELKKAPEIQPIDRRSRAETREDFEKELNKIDKEQLESLINFLQEVESDDSESIESKFLRERESIENALIKLSRHLKKFEDLNSDEERKLYLKEKELKLEASHDWRDKFRLFFFRGLASALLITTLFTIGYIEHEYEWAHLPMSKYLKTSPPAP